MPDINNFIEYKGSSGNIFSRVSGSFVGSIDFHFIDDENFIANPLSPPTTGGVLNNRICTLNSNGIMSNTTNLAVDGGVIFFALKSFVALETIIINFYNDYSKTNIRIYIPSGFATIESNRPYYPSVGGILYGKQSSNRLSYLSDNPFVSVVESINTNLSLIDWNKIQMPVVIEQSNILSVVPARITLIKDRDYTIRFDLNRTINIGTSVWFAMKTDRKNSSYDLGPLEAVIENSTTGIIAFDILAEETFGLNLSKYYADLVMKYAVPNTAPQQYKYIPLKTFDVEIVNPIISSSDI